MIDINHLTDNTKIVLANTAAISVSLSSIEVGLRIVSLVSAIVYTLYKLYKEYKNDRKQQTKGRTNPPRR
jgi:Trk-type K+ transport system membrane component